ncbi:MAG: DbpA RNA binding domain-containing protein [Lachnospiraceae bacterium]|nr:DbpA RNA binding domain-containing protein [Lachnospiraceae bacterium]
MSLDNEKEIHQFHNRLQELADRSYSNSCYTFTEFCGLPELSEYYKLQNNLQFAGTKIFGGYEDAERVIIRFGNPDDLGYEQDFPISCLKVSPLIAKFSDNLTHRDFLGALMNQGMRRSTIGDIKVCDNSAYIFCMENIADYIIEHLDKIKHTSVKCTLINIYDQAMYEQVLAELDSEIPDSKTIQVMSMRADAVISKVYNLSRNDSLNLFKAQKVYINGRLAENNAQQVKLSDVINVRGFGKCKIASSPSETRKGKLAMTIHIW